MSIHPIIQMDFPDPDVIRLLYGEHYHAFYARVRYSQIL